MTERERWIVYPLLFLALGAALRDKLVDRTTTKSIVCQELTIVDEEVPGPHSQRILAKIGAAKLAGGGPTVAYFQISGDMAIDGVVNARQYVYQGLPIVPLPVVPGVAMPNVMPAMPHAVPRGSNPNPPSTKTPNQPPATETKKEKEVAQPPSPAEGAAAPAK